MSICYVTAFLDLNRQEWSSFDRSLDHYFDSFAMFLRLLAKEPSTEASLVVFIDIRHDDRVRNLIQTMSLRNEVNVIPIDDQFLIQSIPIWKRIEKESDIMSSQTYQDLIHHRSQHPEHCNPRYTMINHAKIDFVCYATTHLFPQTDYFAWVDFGYCGLDSKRVPVHLLDLTKLDPDKINYTLIHPIDDRDRDIIYTLKEAPYKVGGFFFFGHRDTLIKYQLLYHEQHKSLQDQNIADDDQHIVLRCYFQQPEIFKMHHLGWYNRALVFFQKDRVPSWESKKKIPIYLVVHVGMLNPSTLDLLEKIKDMWVQTGLWDNSDRILFGAVGEERYLADIKYILQYRGECIARDDRLLVYERPTLEALHRICCETDQDFFVFYCHTKGVTRDPHEFPGVRKWLDYMLYFSCQYYPLILKTLQDHPEIHAIGRDCNRAASYLTHHFSGNFWWSSSHHIRQLSCHIGSEYLDSEMYIGQRGGLCELFSNLKTNWYNRHEDHWENGKPYSFVPTKKYHVVRKIDIPHITYFGRPGMWSPKQLDLSGMDQIFINCETMLDKSVPYKRMWVFLSKDGYWHTYMDEETVRLI